MEYTNKYTDQIYFQFMYKEYYITHTSLFAQYS